MDTFDVEVDYELPKAQQAAIAKARQARARAAEATQATEAAVRALQQGSAKLGVRDVAELVGVSHQRVAQIMKRPGLTSPTYPAEGRGSVRRNGINPAHERCESGLPTLHLDAT